MRLFSRPASQWPLNVAAFSDLHLEVRLTGDAVRLVIAVIVPGSYFGPVRFLGIYGGVSRSSMGHSVVNSRMLYSRAMEADREAFEPSIEVSAPNCGLANRCTENQFLSTIRNNGRASYNGSTGASQASSSEP